MEIKLTPQESEEYFYNSLCNAEGTNYMSGYGIEMDYDSEQYNSAKRTLELQHKNTCYEDILMEILRNGGTLTYNDIEGEGDNTRSITLADVHARVQKTPLKHLTDMIEEEDDADTADAILQTVFFEKVIFG